MKGKSNMPLKIAALILSVCLLAGGIVSAIVFGGKTEATGGSADSGSLDVEIAEGQIKPEELEAGGWSLSSGDFSFEVYRTDNGYGTQIVKGEGTVVAEQVHPINIQIKKPNAEDDYLGTKVETEMLSEDYTSVEVQDNTIIATADVQSKAGSMFAVTDQYIVSEEGGFELIRDIQVVKASEEDEGFNSIVKFKEKDAQKYDAYEYFMPSILYRDSDHISITAIGSDLSMDYIWANESHTALPLIMARNMENGFSLSIGRVIDEEIYSGVDESQGSWVISKFLDYGSTGFSNVDGYVSLDICYPGMEGNICYLDGSLEFLRRSHPVREDVEHSYEVYIQPAEEDSFTDAMVSAYKGQYKANQIPEVEADLDKVYDVTLDLFDTFTQEYNYGWTTMPFALYLDGEVAALDSLIGFVGQQTSVGFHLIREGIENGDAEERAKGEALIDTWVRDGFTEHGFPNIWFVTGNYDWAPTSFITCYVRYMSDGMEGILDAYLEEKEAGVIKDAWLARCVEYADWLVKAQNDDGSWYRAYNPHTGEVSQGEDGKIGNDKNNTSCAVRYLIRMYEQTGDDKYLNAAIRAGEFVYANGYLSDMYYGGTPDQNNMIDKEAGTMAMYAFTSLYQATGEEKWLDAAEHAAICCASFVYSFDFTVWGKETNNIYRDLAGTSGISRISTGNSGVDVFSAYFYYEYFKLYVYTGDEFYYELAELIQDNTKQFVNIDGRLPYGYDGIINEALQITHMFYSSDVASCLTWCNIALIDPIASMEDAFGVKTIQEAEALGRDTLLEMLDAYGAGGNFR